MSIFELENFYKVAITKACTTGATNIYVTTKPVPTNGILVISSGTQSLREIIRYTGTGTDGDGDYVTVASAGHRGLGGTTDQAHAIGESVRMNYTAEHQKEIDDTINAIVAAGAPDASTSTKGIARLSTAPTDPAIPIAVSVTDTTLVKTAKDTAFLNAITGMISMYASGTPPTGFLLCDGSAVSRTTYADLFAVTSTTYGAGDGSTTFNLPDLRSRFPLGYSASAPTKVFTFASRASNVITVTGADNHAHNELQTGQAVLYSAPSGAMTGLTHNTTYYVVRVTATTFSLATSVANANAGTVITLSSDGTGAQTFTATYTARPMAQQGGTETSTQVASHFHTIPTASPSGAGLNITQQGTNLQNQDNNEVTNPVGSDTPNNMPLFTVVNYIIKT
jgi:microcystin-dependent protein